MSFNNLSFAEAERLALLAEEMGEAIQAIGKVLRHGYTSVNPLLPEAKRESNRRMLTRECGDVMAALQLMYSANDLNFVTVMRFAEAKRAKVEQYLHHQTETPNV